MAGICRLLDMLPTVPCLTLMATYDSAPPDWHLLLPDASRAIQLIANESSKRPDVPGCGFVIQARAGWSASHLNDPPERWAQELLREASQQVGDWVLIPSWSRPHRWRYARTDLASELNAPVVLQIGKARLGLGGELFARGAGVEAAYLSGRALAQRLAGGSDG
jgi:predicted NAD/FAD-dependent oxidoreductase